MWGGGKIEWTIVESVRIMGKSEEGRRYMNEKKDITGIDYVFGAACRIDDVFG